MAAITIQSGDANSFQDGVVFVSFDCAISALTILRGIISKEQSVFLLAKKSHHLEQYFCVQYLVLLGTLSRLRSWKRSPRDVVTDILFPDISMAACNANLQHTFFP